MPLSTTHPGTAATPRIVVFDIGGVLIEWNPRYLYRKLFQGDDDAMEAFLSTVCTSEWNLEQDRGRSWQHAVASLSAAHPGQNDLIAAYDRRWDEMVTGEIPGTPAILAELKARGTPVYALTNFSVDKLERTRRRFDFLNAFDGITVSAEVGLVKPDPAIYRKLIDTYGLTAGETLFIDDVAKNVEGARAVGMHAVQFTGAAALRADLESFGLL